MGISRYKGGNREKSPISEYTTFIRLRDGPPLRVRYVLLNTLQIDCMAESTDSVVPLVVVRSCNSLVDGGRRVKSSKSYSATYQG